MPRFADLSLRLKITLGMVLVTGLALVLSSLAYMAFQAKLFRETKVTRAQILATIVGDNSRATLAFNDPASATRILDSFKESPNLEKACLFDAAGNLFATYPAGATSFPPLEPVDTAEFRSGKLLVFHGIRQQDERLGTLFIQVGSDDLDAAFRLNLIFTISLLIALALLALLLSFRFQRVITAPLLDLAKVANEVSLKKDYSVRARRRGGDEIGALVDSFNGMLGQIEGRDAQLSEYRDHLEEQVASRTEQLFNANQQLFVAKRKAEDMSRAKSAFLANMSHELRTPLNAIMLYTDLLKEQAVEAGRESDSADLDRISGSADHLLRLINDVLDLSKVEAGKMTLASEPVLLDAVLEEVVQTLRPAASKQGDALETDYPMGLPPFLGDVTRLRQILYNLLSNACKFTQNGTIRLEVAPFQVDASPWLRITVRDTGIGMSEEQLGRIFQDFTQADENTSRRYGGTGLGLSLSRRLCELMGGSLSVKSEPGVGSIFTLELPAPPPKGGSDG